MEDISKEYLARYQYRPIVVGFRNGSSTSFFQYSAIHFNEGIRMTVLKNRKLNCKFTPFRVQQQWSSS